MILIALTCAAPSLSFAHHGTALYNMRESTRLAGTVTTLDWRNPHCLLHFDAKNGAGKVQHWTVVLYHPAWLARAGWTSTTLKPGDTISITFHAAKDATANGYFSDQDNQLIVNGKALPFHLAGDDHIK